MNKHGKYLSDSEWTVVNGKRGRAIDSEVKVPDSCFKLIFDIPSLALIEDAYCVAGKGSGIMRAGDRNVRYEHFIIEIGHPIRSIMIRMPRFVFVVVAVVQFQSGNLN